MFHLQRKIEIFLTILIQLVLAVDQSTYFNLFSSKTKYILFIL